MATDITDLKPHDVGIGEINKYGFRTDENYVFKSRKGLDARDRLPDLGDEERAAVDARLPPEGLEVFHSKPTPPWGGELAHSTSTTSTTT